MDSDAPSIPTNLNFSRVTSASLDLNWSASTDVVGVKGYYVLRGPSPSNLSGIGNVSGTIFSDRVAPDTVYYYSVRAYDQAGWISDPSQPKSVRTPKDTTYPSAPGSLQGQAMSLVSAKLTWSAATDNYYVAAYKIYRGTSVASLTVIGSSTTTTYTDMQAAPGASYIYGVSALDLSSNEGARRTVPVVMPPDTMVPSTPLALQAQTVLSNVNLTWSAATDNVRVTGYRIYRGASLSALNMVAWVTTLSYSEVRSVPGASYFYAVSAVDSSSNEGARSNVVSVTMPR